MANAKSKQDTSTGTKSNTSQTKPQGNAGDSDQAARPSKVAQAKNASDNFSKTLADILSLIQEDVREYQKTLAKNTGTEDVVMDFGGDGGYIYLPAPTGHSLDFEDGHITLDGEPVTGWGIGK